MSRPRRRRQPFRRLGGAAAAIALAVTVLVGVGGGAGAQQVLAKPSLGCARPQPDVDQASRVRVQFGHCFSVQAKLALVPLASPGHDVFSVRVDGGCPRWLKIEKLGGTLAILAGPCDEGRATPFLRSGASAQFTLCAGTGLCLALQPDGWLGLSRNDDEASVWTLGKY